MVIDMESKESQKINELPKREDSPRWCIFERKICRYANKQGPVFNCNAPSDDEMPCK